MIIFTFTLACFIISFLFQITCCTTESAFTVYEIFSVIVLALFLFAIISNALTFMSFAFFGSHVFGNKRLQLPVHLFKLIMNGYYLSSAGFISIRVGLTMHVSSFKNRHLVWSETLALRAKELIKLNRTIKRLNIILNYPLSLNTCECYYVRFINRIVIDSKIILISI